MRKEQQQPHWSINFAKIWLEHVLRIKTEGHVVLDIIDWHSEPLHLPPWHDRVKLHFT